MRSISSYNPIGTHHNCGKFVKCAKCHAFDDMFYDQIAKFKFAIDNLINQNIYPSDRNIFKFLESNRYSLSQWQRKLRTEILIKKGWIHSPGNSKFQFGIGNWLHPVEIN